MRIILFLWLISGFLVASAQKGPQNPYGLNIISSYKQYQQSVRLNPDNELLEIKKVIPGIELDIHYARTDNFMRQVMYKQARAFARKPVVEALKQVQAELNRKGYGLKIFDAYRPYSVTLDFYKKASDKSFVANPKEGSKHNRGCAIDLTLIVLHSRKEVEMPTPYDSFEAAAAPAYTQLTASVKKNRDFLIQTMQKHGFKVISNEWWHFDYTGWKNYSLADIPFEKL